MTPFEQLWPWLLWGCAAWFGWRWVIVWRRGYIIDEDGEIFHHKDYPRGFMFNNVIAAISLFCLIYSGYRAMYGWS